jgi:hypothetical protein
MFARPVFSGPNIYRAAELLIWFHGAHANIEAARIADAMRGFGDRDGQAFWIKVGQAIAEVETQPALQPHQREELNAIWVSFGDSGRQT